MTRIFVPHPYQKLAIQHMHSHMRGAVWASMGMGKTVSAATFLADLYLLGEGLPALILAPLRVARDTWPNEFKKWEHLSHLDISPIIGTDVERRLALYKKAHVYTCNYENIMWLIETLGDAWPFETVIADESTKLKGCRVSYHISRAGNEFLTGQGGKRAKALAGIAHTKVKRWINLTGTPAAQGLQDLWGQTWFLDKGARLGRSYTAFTRRWFTKGYDGFSIEPKEYAAKQVNAALSDICLPLQGKDWFNVDEPVIRRVEVELPKAARAMYKSVERDMFAEFEGHTFSAANAAAKSLKCLQIASGAAYIDKTVEDDDAPNAREWKNVHDEKIEALRSIVGEASGMPVLVAYHFRSDRERILKALKGARVLRTAQDENDWNAGKAPVMLMHPKSAGHGLNLQDGGNIIVFFSHWWSNEEYLQATERIGPLRQKQSGYDRPVFVYHIVARDTIDEYVIAARENNTSIQDAIMRRRSHAG